MLTALTPAEIDDALRHFRAALRHSLEQRTSALDDVRLDNSALLALFTDVQLRRMPSGRRLPHAILSTCVQRLTVDAYGTYRMFGNDFQALVQHFISDNQLRPSEVLAKAVASQTQAQTEDADLQEIAERARMGLDRNFDGLLRGLFQQSGFTITRGLELLGLSDMLGASLPNLVRRREKAVRILEALEHETLGANRLRAFPRYREQFHAALPPEAAPPKAAQKPGRKTLPVAYNDPPAAAPITPASVTAPTAQKAPQAFATEIAKLDPPIASAVEPVVASAPASLPLISATTFQDLVQQFARRRLAQEGRSSEPLGAANFGYLIQRLWSQKPQSLGSKSRRVALEQVAERALFYFERNRLPDRIAAYDHRTKKILLFADAAEVMDLLRIPQRLVEPTRHNKSLTVVIHAESEQEWRQDALNEKTSDSVESAPPSAKPVVAKAKGELTRPKQTEKRVDAPVEPSRGDVPAPQQFLPRPIEPLDQRAILLASTELSHRNTLERPHEGARLSELGFAQGYLSRLTAALARLSPAALTATAVSARLAKRWPPTEVFGLFDGKGQICTTRTGKLEFLPLPTALAELVSIQPLKLYNTVPEVSAFLHEQRLEELRHSGKAPASPDARRKPFGTPPTFEEFRADYPNLSALIAERGVTDIKSMHGLVRTYWPDFLMFQRQVTSLIDEKLPFNPYTKKLHIVLQTLLSTLQRPLSSFPDHRMIAASLQLPFSDKSTPASVLKDAEAFHRERYGSYIELVAEAFCKTEGKDAKHAPHLREGNKLGILSESFDAFLLDRIKKARGDAYFRSSQRHNSSKPVRFRSLNPTQQLHKRDNYRLILSGSSPLFTSDGAMHPEADELLKVIGVEAKKVESFASIRHGYPGSTPKDPDSVVPGASTFGKAGLQQG